MATNKDYTGLTPFVLFGIFALVVGYLIWENTRYKGAKEAEE